MTEATIKRPAPGAGRPSRERRASTARLAVVPVLVAVGAAAGAATLLITVLPTLSFAYRSGAAHASIETAASLVAALATVLVWGRALRSSSRNDVLLAAALATLALTNLVFSLLPTLFGWSPQFSAWAGVSGRLAGAVLFACAALVPERRLRDVRRALRRGAVAVMAGVALVALVVGVAGEGLPSALDPALSPESANRVRVVGHPVVLVLQAVLILIYTAATVGFAARASRRSDRLLRGFAVACLLAAFARVNYFLFPSVYSEWVYTGDVLRLAQYLVILGAVAVEVLEYQRRASVTAVLDERRRVARELHDGLAQELAFIRGSATRIQRRGRIDHERLREMIAATERALDESRAAIAALSRPIDEPLISSLRHSAEAVAFRTGARVLASGDEVAVDVDRRHALMRIVREAAGNATEHGGATEIRLHVEARDGLCVSVADNGSGFDVHGAVRPDAYGLASMRDRAEALGGRLEIRSQPGEGTTIEVVLP